MLRYLALVIPLCLLCIAGVSAPSHAQTPRVLCPEGQELDPYEIWSVVDSEADAKAFLRSEFERFQSPMEFATWLSCQDFSVVISKGPFGSPLTEVEVRIGAGFLVAPRDRPPLWGENWLLDTVFKKHAQTFVIYIGKGGQISQIEIGITSK